MSSVMRSLSAGVIVAGAVAWSLTKLDLSSDSPTEPALEVRADHTLGSAEFGPGAANEKDGQVDPEVADLRSQVALLRSDLAEVQRQLRQLALSASQAQLSSKPSGAEEPADAIVLSEQELREQEADAMEAENQRSVARMKAGEAALRSESTDAIWSTHAAEALLEAFQNKELSGTAVRDLECRATLCRVELEHRDRAQQLAFEQHFRFKVGAILPRMMLHSEEQQDGTITAVIYLAREGHDLPRPTY